MQEVYMEKVYRFLIVLLFSVIILVSCNPSINETNKWDGATDTTWYNENDKSFSLSTASELAGLVELVEKGNSFEGKTLILAKDINLNGLSWKPIGTEATPFKGTIQGDGSGIVISGLRMTEEIKSTNTDGQHVAGFIGFFGGGGIKNITFNNAEITVGEDVAAAIVAGFMNGGTVENIKVINATISGKHKSDMGGIAGKLYDSGSITDCVITGTSIILDAEGKDWNSCNIGSSRFLEGLRSN